MTALRDQALTAARHAIRDGQWWLPPAGQEQLVDAILAVVRQFTSADIPQKRAEPEPPQELTVRKIAILRQLCPTGQHIEHPGYSCDESDWWATRWAEVFDNASRAFDALTAQDAEIPAALRGPNWKARP